MTNTRSVTGERMATALLAVSIVALLVLELRSLYTAPVPDSYLWWGDESWLMLEFREQILHGVLRHPLALGSTLASGNGVIFSNMWLTALLYGAPAGLLDLAKLDVVFIGRTVTAVLAGGLLVSLYTILRRSHCERPVALFGVLLLASSRAFFLTSHSSRYDILSALAILWGVAVMLRRSAHTSLTSKSTITSGVLLACGLLISVHVPIALALAACAVVLLYPGEERFTRFAQFCAGGAVVLLVICLISLATSTLSLFGHGHSGAYAMNVHDIPILRPFSRSVQTANILQRLARFRDLAPSYLVAMPVALVLIVLRRKTMHAPPALRKIVIVSLVLLSWLLFESAAPPSYIIYVLPVLALSIALLLKRLPKYWMMAVLSVGTILLMFFGTQDVLRAERVGELISAQNAQALNGALATIHRDDIGRPLVLAFNPAVHALIGDTAVRLMTTHLVEFPANDLSLERALATVQPKYCLIYRSALRPDYMREVSPIGEVLSRRAVMLGSWSGSLTDIGRSYFAFSEDPQLAPAANDTLQLYRFAW